MNRLSACRKFCGVHSWQREWHKMYGWCECVVVSFPSSLVGFLGFHPYMCLFSFRKLFVTCSCCLFFVLFLFFCLFRNGKKEERWEGRPSGRCMVYIKYDNVHNHKASSKSKHHTFFIYSGGLKFEQSLKPHKT